MLMVGTILGGWSGVAGAQETPPPAAPAPAPAVVAQAPSAGVIRSIQVRGAERLEPATVISYSNLQPGQSYSAESLDSALKDLYATELFADVVITGADTGQLLITVRENPVINRIILEGNKRIKDEKITPEIRLAPRQIFTRTKVTSDVARIVELYKRSGRFAATVEPKIVQLDQNRVDLVFEINEGAVSKVRAINIVGNEKYSDGRLRKEMYTREAGGILGFLRSNDSYDPDRLAADQQKLRAFYLTEGYADFRVVSALAELTPDRRDFIITYVIEEGPRYKFGAVEVESALRDLDNQTLRSMINIKTGDWFDAKMVEDVVTGLNEVAGLQGYAFADISPQYERDPEKLEMNLTFRVNESPRVYVEKVEVTGNTVTRDKVIRREFRINEGDAFNAVKIRRSQDRLQSLGFFQENLEIKQAQGSAPDRVVLSVDVEEKSTGELQLSAGYSSLEKFILSANISQRNFMGKGQQVDVGVNYSRYSRSIQLGITEPFLFDKNIALGGQIYRRDLNSFNQLGNDRRTTYRQVSTGLGTQLGFPITEFLSFGTRYSLSQDKLTLDKLLFYEDLDNDDTTPVQCSPRLAGRYLCDEIGKRLTSSIGYSVIYDSRDGLRATRGQRIVFNQDFAGLGGDVKYIRTRGEATKYFRLPADFILSTRLEGGYIHPLQSAPGDGKDAIRLTDRFFGAQLRGFDIRGIGPRITRKLYADTAGNFEDEGELISDAIGGRAYYMGRLEVEFPVGANIRNLGLRPSAFVDVGSVWKITKPTLAGENSPGFCSLTTGTSTQTVEAQFNRECPDVLAGSTFIPGYREFFQGNSPKPRLSIGVGVN